MLSAFDKCPRQAFHRYVAKDLPKETSPALDWGIAVHEALEAHVRDYVPLPEGMERYEPRAAALPLGSQVERKLGIRFNGSPCDFFATDVWGRGKLDISVVNGPHAVIIDWKTGKVREDPDELEVFAVLLDAHHPGIIGIMGFYVWLATSKIGKIHDLSDTVVKLAQIRGRWERVQKAHRTDHWPPQQSPLCGWCSVYSCEFNPKKHLIMMIWSDDVMCK